MPNFAFRSDHHEEDVLRSEHHAKKLRSALRAAGHDAHIERSHGEHRVWVQHPEYKDTFQYADKGEVDRLLKGGEPHWIAK